MSVRLWELECEAGGGRGHDPRILGCGLHRLAVEKYGEVTAKVVKDTEDGDIILMHDEFKTSVEAAFRIIDNLTAKGILLLQ